MTRVSIRGSENQGVTFVELFFDLVFVFAVTQVTSVLAHDLTGGGVVRGLIVFWLVWWAWTQYTWSLNAADTERMGVQLFTLVATAVAFIMALTVPEITSDAGRLFCFSYVLLRVAGIAMQWRLNDDNAELAVTVRRWTLFSSLGLVAVLLAGFLGPDLRYAALAVGAVLDVVAATRSGRGVWDLFTGHFTERHGLIVIVALGESLIAAGVTASGSGLDNRALVAALVAVVVTCAMWWTYFGWAKDLLEERFSIQPTATQGRFGRDVYSFGHFPIIAGVIGFAVAIEETVAHPDEHLPTAGAVALVTGITLFVGGTGLALWLSGARPSNVRWVAVAALVVVALLTFGTVPAWSAMAISAAVVGGLAIVERPPAH